ncbi:dimethyl sulfoxide reductase chain YnfE [Escherichia coli]|nr:dimethyl sulfoxide reductase chain YnfE [Escherichia coli]
MLSDPRYTDTAAGREDEWLPIRPGTDAALVAGIAWVLINENLVDQPFLDKYCVGYGRKKPYPQMHPKMVTIKPIFLVKVTIKQRKRRSGLRKLPGIPEDRIIKLGGVKLAQQNPLISARAGGPQRQANGELTARAIAMLPILTGNVGISGGNSGARGIDLYHYHRTPAGAG